MATELVNQILNPTLFLLDDAVALLLPSVTELVIVINTLEDGRIGEFPF